MHPAAQPCPVHGCRELLWDVRAHGGATGDAVPFGRGPTGDPLSLRSHPGASPTSPALPSSRSLHLFAAAAVLNTAIPAPVQPAQTLPAAVQPRPPLQPQSVFPPAPAVPSQPPILPQPAAAPTPPVAKPLEPQTQIAVQPAGFAFNPGIVRSRAAPIPRPLPFPGTRSPASVSLSLTDTYPSPVTTRAALRVA